MNITSEGFNFEQITYKEQDLYCIERGYSVNTLARFSYHRKNCHGIIYTVDSENTFNLLESQINLWNDILREKEFAGVPLLVVATKADGFVIMSAAELI